MNSGLRDIFYRNLMIKDFDSKEFDSKLNEIYLELKKQKDRLDEALINLRVYCSCKRSGYDRWWITKSQKESCLANQLAIDFYKSGLEVFKCQFCDVITWLDKYRKISSNT